MICCFIPYADKEHVNVGVVFSALSSGPSYFHCAPAISIGSPVIASHSISVADEESAY
ncbi:MAG: hypothetical protein HQL32_07205 [Planctomycetes bacterium]|nr:hypothetical protein [Planctomycetota bacterium]